jgi:hypothetical protein
MGCEKGIGCYQLTAEDFVIVIRSPRNTAKGAAEWELGRETRKGRMLCSVVKFWYRTLLMEKEELLKCNYEWQAENLKCDGCTRNLSDKLYKFGLGYLWLDRHGRDFKNICQINNTRCNDIKRQPNREKLKEKKSLVSCWNMKQEMGRLDISRFLSFGLSEGECIGINHAP